MVAECRKDGRRGQLLEVKLARYAREMSLEKDRSAWVNSHPPKRTTDVDGFRQGESDRQEGRSRQGVPYVPTHGDRRSYTQVVSDNNKSSRFNPSNLLIQMLTNTCMKSWINEFVIIGEAHSLDHIGTFHSYLKGDTKTKYLGGLFLALEFSCTVDAKNFLSNYSHCSDAFNWVKLGEYDLQFERVAWLKIIGLPIPLWDEENFSKIVSSFGRVINPFDDIKHRSDPFMGKAIIITTRRRWINEEVQVSAHGKTFSVGVVEYTDDRSPFVPCLFDKVVEDEIDKFEEDSDGI
ncbi:hypothetical protein L1887_01211 [Cichorium endivia]|nr:hypothetical protein L1887_01211 [Cichorium endivia]